MPYASLAQAAYFHANADKIGQKTVDEFDKASKGKSLPNHVKKDKKMKKEKEKGLPKNAPKAVKKADDKIDNLGGTKEGSKKDLEMDKELMKLHKKGVAEGKKSFKPKAY